MKNIKIVEASFGGNDDRVYSWAIDESAEVHEGDAAIVQNRDGIAIVSVVGIAPYDEDEHGCVKYLKKVLSVVPASQVGDTFAVVPSKQLDLMSPSRGVPYTIMDALEKGRKRSNVYASRIWAKKVDENSTYGDADYIIGLVDFRCSESVWSESVSFVFPEIYVKAHVKNGTDAPQLELGGWGTGGEIPFEERKYAGLFDEGEGISFSSCKIYVGEESDSAYAQGEKHTHVYFKDFSDKEKELIFEMVKEHLLSEMFIRRWYDRSL